FSRRFLIIGSNMADLARDLYRFHSDDSAHLSYPTGYFGAANTMSRRVKKPLRPAGDRPKGARPYRGSSAERPPSFRPGGKPPARFPAAPPRAAKPFVPEPEKVAPEPPPLPTKVQTVVVTADENNMRVDRFLGRA